MADISPERVRALRVRSQHLRRKAPRGRLADVVRSLCGVNAQSAPAMMLSLRARVEGLEAADVEETIARGDLVRTWAMRGTLHLLDRDDMGWMVSLLGPASVARGRSRRRELGLTDEVLAKSLAELPGIFNGASLTRGEVVDRLAGRGIALEAGQAPYHLIAFAALNGLLCMGPDRPDGDPTYRLAGVGQKIIKKEEALAGLAGRYLAGYGPAAPEDLAAWSGLPSADAKRGWGLNKGRSTEPIYAGPVVNLLPAFDAYVLGYSDRGYVVPDKYRKEVYHGGQTVPVVLVDGLAAGVWRYERRGKKLHIKVSPFGRLGKPVKGLIDGEAEDVGRFFGLSTSIDYVR